MSQVREGEEMTELRKQFEALPEIKRIVSCDEIKWCNVYNWYRTDNTDANSIYHVAWLNGAWHAFQEQQKAIENLKVGLTDIWTNLDDRQSKEWIIEHCENIIKEVLK